MIITAAMIKELREKTGAGMTDCKKALTEAQGDMEQSIIVLRERGLAAAAKKAGRTAAEGVVEAVILPCQSRGYIVEVNCETDFVTRNQEFQGFVSNIKNIIAEKQPANLDDLLACSYNAEKTVKDTLTGLVAIIGENIVLRRYIPFGSGQNYVAQYTHGNNRIVSMVEIQGSNIASIKDNALLAETAKSIGMQIAAMRPLFLNHESIPAQAIELEREIYMTQYRNEGKPEAILPKIVESRIQTWFKEVCLVEQSYIKEEKQSVGQMITLFGKSIGIQDINVCQFIRIELGEGVEKKSTDFATEVQEQIAAAKKG